MKNLHTITRPDEIHEYVRNLWRTDIFRESHDDEEGYIRQVVDLLAQRAAIFFEMDEPSIEWSQFTTWMGAYALRPDYENDAIHDLYYLHEFWHGATMHYEGTMSFVQWHRKMCENEMQASVHSEAYVYFALPGLRELSFDFEIWVDRLLEEQESFVRLDSVREYGDFTVKYANTLDTIFSRRKAVMKSPDPFDFLEMQIHQYALQNMQWSNIWKDHYQEVEAQMESYLEQAEEDPEAAVEAHVEWLLEKKGEIFYAHTVSETAVDGVTPYQAQAEAFAAVVKANKKRWGNDVLK